MTNRKDQIRTWILSLVSALVISVWADVKAYNPASLLTPRFTSRC
jgi:hypothetical protein